MFALAGRRRDRRLPRPRARRRRVETVGGDAQRTGWVRTDPRISKDSAAKGLQLLWKRQLDKARPR